MFDFMSSSVPAGAAPAPAPSNAERASTTPVPTDEGKAFASALAALADAIDGVVDADEDDADPSSNPVVPAFAFLPDAIQPGPVPGWMVAFSLGEKTGNEEAEETGDDATDPTAGTAGAASTDLGITDTWFAGVAAPVAAAVRHPQAETTTPQAPTVPALPVPGSGEVPAGQIPVPPPSNAAAASSAPDTFVATDPAAAVALGVSTDAGADVAGLATETLSFTARTTAESAAESDADLPAQAALAAAEKDARNGSTRPVMTELAGVAEDTPASSSKSAASLAAFLTPHAQQSEALTAASRDGGLSFEFSGHSSTPHGLVANVKASVTSFTSALANTPTFEGLPAETTDQIVQAMRLQFARGGGEAHIKLEPHHFGEMKVSIKVEQGQVTARLEAEVPAVREWLQNNQAVLRNSMAEQNLTLDRLDVAEPKESRDSERRQNQSSSREDQPKPRRRRQPSEGTFEVMA